MPAPSLFSSAMKMCIRNITSIEDVGDMLYSQVKPLLARIESPDQLCRIEANSPQIAGESAELWQKLIARDVPLWKKKNYLPKNVKSWSKIYKRYRREQAEEIAQDREKLREQMMGLQKKREQNVSKFVDLKTMPKIPRDSRMRAQNGGVPFRKKNELGSTLTFTGGSKTKMVDGQSVLRRARREAKEIQAMTKLSKPTHDLANSRVSHAPAAMIREQQIKKQPNYISAPKVYSSRKSAASIEFSGSSAQPGLSLEDREARLRRAQQSTMKRSADEDVKPLPSTTVDFSDDEEVDDLFDERPSKKIRPSKPVPKPVVVSSPPTAKSPPASTRPSDVISQMINRKPTEVKRPQATKPEPAAVGLQRSRSNSPGTQAQRHGPNPSATPRKKKEVDIFNRRPVKRPRAI